MIHIYSSAAPNYLGKLIALARSVQHHVPGATFHWLAAEPRRSETLDLIAGEPIDEVHFLDDLPGNDHQDPTWLFQHDIVELATAIKPALALELLGRTDCDLLLYLDPDIVLFSPLDDLFECLENAAGVLTPHVLQPSVDPAAVGDHELAALKHGVFNLGFLGVRPVPQGFGLLEWWRARCLAYCQSDWSDGVFTDQKWMNFAPVFLDEVEILRQSRFNVAPWNIHQRKVTGTFDEGFEVDGEPLGFYHFTGFDRRAHHQAIERWAPGNHSVASLADWYEQWTESLAPPGLSWSLGSYDDGYPIPRPHRAIYRRRHDLRRVFPNPFSTGTGTLREWFEIQGPLEYPELLLPSE